MSSPTPTPASTPQTSPATEPAIPDNPPPQFPPPSIPLRNSRYIQHSPGPARGTVAEEFHRLADNDWSRPAAAAGSRPTEPAPGAAKAAAAARTAAADGPSDKYPKQSPAPAICNPQS